MFKQNVVVGFYTTLLLILVLAITAYRHKDVYSVTAYSNHKISINKAKWLDYRFASNRKTYFGGVAADRSIPFGTKIQLVPLTPADARAIDKYLEGRREFIVEDRGYLIKGKAIDIFLPRRLGGHKNARKWGRRRMKVILTFPEDQK